MVHVSLIVEMFGINMQWTGVLYMAVEEQLYSLLVSWFVTVYMKHSNLVPCPAWECCMVVVRVEVVRYGGNFFARVFDCQSVGI